MMIVVPLSAGPFVVVMQVVVVVDPFVVVVVLVVFVHFVASVVVFDVVLDLAMVFRLDSDFDQDGT